MFRSNSNLGFPRKVVTYYLLFCIVSVVWLAMSVLLASHSVLDARATSSCLARLGKTAAALEMEYLRSGEKNLQAVLQRNQWSSSLQNCSVVSNTGIILASSDLALVGQQAPKSQGNRLRWGDVTGIQYEDASGRIINEYRVPLNAQEEHFGSLSITVRQPNFWGNLSEVVREAPLALLLPLGLIAAGGWFLSRLAHPLAKVDDQLRGLARERIASRKDFQRLPAKDAISIGWNRIIELLDSSDSGNDLNSRVTKAIAERQQGKMQTVLQNLSDGIAVTDIEGRVTFANRAVAALLGSEADEAELLGAELEERIAASSESSTDSSLFEKSAVKRTSITEVERSGDNAQRTLRVARLPLADETTLGGHVWSLRDITQQKLAEKMRDQFIDVATHELRTPLSNIKAYAETLATCDSIKIEEQKEFCNTINSEVTRLARFVDDLLSISSMESGAITIEKSHTVSARMFEEVLAKVQPLMDKKQIEFLVDMPAKMSDLRLDKDKIVAVLVNLLGNAAKYTEVGGRVSLRVKLDERQIHILVEDSGVGIAPGELPKVFDKFFRSSDPRVQAETGTGLGLSLAREVVRMHGGDITVESKIDQGTTFITTMPVE